MAMTSPGGQQQGASGAVWVRLRGRVQGVGFRDFTYRHACRYGLTGYVRNVPDGSVEVWAEGPSNALEQLLQALERGPAAARVQSMEVRREAATGRYSEFRITG